MVRTMQFLFALAAGALFLALAAVPAHAADVLVVVDSSGSMSAKTRDGQVKLDAARNALARLAPQLEDHQLALMLFGHRHDAGTAASCTDIEMVVPFGKGSSTSLTRGLASLRALGRTPLALSLKQAREALLGLKRDTAKIVIVLTDGNETCGGDPIAEATALRNAGIDVQLHVIGFAVGPNQTKQLQEIATAGGGTYSGAADASGLEAVLPKVMQSALVRTEEKVTSRAQLLDDSFDGEAFGAHWEIIRPDLDRIAVAEGSAYLVTQHNGVWPRDMAKTKNLLVTKQPVDELDVDVETEFKFQMVAQHQAAGLMLYQDDRNFVSIQALAGPWGYNLQRRIMFTRVIDGEAAHRFISLGNGKDADYVSYPFKLVRRGVFVQGLRQVRDPKTEETRWVEIGRTAVPTMRSVRVGLFATNVGGKGMPEADAQFSFVRVTAPTLERTRLMPSTDGAIFATDFTDPEAFGTRFEVVRKDDSHIGIERGLHVVTQPGVHGNKDMPVKNLVLLNEALPKGNFTLDVQASGRLTSQGNAFGVILYQDDENYLELFHDTRSRGGYAHNPSFILAKATRGEVKHNVVYATPDPAKDSDTFIFRLQKKGPRFTASVYAWDTTEKKMNWVQVASQSLLRFNGRVGLIARSPSAAVYGGAPSHQVPVRFESLVLRK